MQNYYKNCLFISLNKKLIKHSFKGFARSYAIEKLYDEPMTQLHASKLTIKELFEELLIKMYGFKYIITLLVTLTKDYKVKNDDRITEEKTEYAMLYFNSYTKRVINENFRDDVDLSFKEVINKIQNWIKDGFRWAIDLVNCQYVHVSKYNHLHASSYLELPKKYAHPRKGLINIKNKNNKCFLWCHVRHLDLDCSKDPCRISKKDKEVADKLDYSGIDIPASEKDYPNI